ncbi:DNA-directed RNA polymerase III subunit C31 [Coniothyrium glycines]
MPPAARGGRGGARGGRGGGAFGSARGTVTIAGTELNWDLTGLDIQKGPAERFPEAPPPQAPHASAAEAAMVQHYLAVRDRIHEGPFYTILNDGMKNGLKRKANEPAPTEASLFNPFTDNQTYSAKYLKVRRRLPKLDERPYVTELFPAELRSILVGIKADGSVPKKRRTLGVTKVNAVTQIERLIQFEQERTNDAEARGDEEDEDAEEEEEEVDDDKPDAVDEDDNYSAASTDSEESDDDYNAEQYFDNGDDDDIDDADPYENTYE